MNYRRIQNLALFLYFFSINFEVYDPLQTDGAFSVAKLTGFLYMVTILPQLTQFLRLDGIKQYLRPIWYLLGFLFIMNWIHINSQFYEIFDRTIFQNIILFWILLNHERQEPGIIEKGMLSFAIGSIVLAALYTAGIGIGFLDNRVTIFGDNQNTVGIRMCISMFIIVVNVIQNRLDLYWIRYLLLLPVPIMMKLMVETGSRVAFVSFVLSLFVGLWILKTKRIWGKLIVFIGSSIVFFFVWQMLLQTIDFKLRLLQSIQEGDLSGREIIWQSILPIFKDNPLFGIGRTGYNYFTKSIFGIVKSPHNVFLEVLCYTGLVGFVFYVTFLYRVFSNSYKTFKNTGFILPLILLVPICGLLLSAQLLDVKVGWIIFAYTASFMGFKTANISRVLNWNT